MQPFLKLSQDPPSIPNNPPRHHPSHHHPSHPLIHPQNPNPNLPPSSLITSLDHPPNPKPQKAHPYLNHQLLISVDRSPLNFDHSVPFSPLSSPLPDLRTTDHDSPTTFSPRGSFSLDHNPSSSSQNSNLGSINRSSPAIERLSFDSSISSHPFQPPSLPVPKCTNPISNIWAQSLDTATSTTTTATTTSSCAGSDLELNSPLLSHPSSMVNRRFSHLGSTHPHTQSLIGSPASITDPIGAISLSTDRYRGSLTPTSPLSASFGPNSLPSNFYQTWYDTHLSNEGLLGKDERIGRSKARDIFGTVRPPGSYRDPSVGSIGSPCSSSARSGIGLSNMSPFTGASLLPPGSMSFGGSLSNQNLDVGYRLNRGRDSSLGAIGSGRMTSRSSIASAAPVSSGLGLASSGSRVLNKGSEYGFVGSVGTDSWLTGGRSLSNDLDEDDEFAQPTKSGATSRRHSVSAFTARSLTQGFESVGSRSNSYNNSSNLNERKNDPDGASDSGPLDADEDCAKINSFDTFGRGSSALSEEDLCFAGDFNSLNLDLETQANQEPADRLTFQFNHSNQLQSNRSSQPYFQTKSNYPSEVNDRSVPRLPSMPWSINPSSVSQDHPIPGPNNNTQFGPGNFARKSSFSAGDPFSASAQASRYFASQAGHTLNFLQDNPPSAGSRFPFCHSGPNLQPLGSISSPSVTTFSASGLLSAPSPHSRQVINPEMESKQMGGPFDPAHPFYSASSSQPHLGGSPISPIFQIPSGLSGSYQPPNIPTQLNNLSVSSPRSTNIPGPGPNELSELGKGIPLHQIPPDCRLYIVEFKGGRTDLFYLSLQPHQAVENIQKGDLVIVEADRGKDLGKVVHDQISIEEVKKFQKQQVEIVLNQLNNSGVSQTGNGSLTGNHLLNSVGLGSSTAAVGELNAQAAPNAANVSRLTKEIHPKKIFSKATQLEIQSLSQKIEEERKALSLCRSKALQRGLKMEITSAEWQWDRRKLTFFFIADKRIDFRDLVKDLFRTWKTRIWMCSVNP